MCENEPESYFRFYPVDFLDDTNVREMSLEQIGAYSMLLCHCWVDGTIPADFHALNQLLKIDRGEDFWRPLLKCFLPPTIERRLLHPLLKRERHCQAYRPKSNLADFTAEDVENTIEKDWVYP